MLRYLVLLERETHASVELLDAIDIDRVNPGTIIGEESGQGTTHDLGTVDDGDDSSVKAVAIGEDSVVDSHGLHDLDNAQGCTRDDTLFGLGGVQKANVVVHVVDILVVETLDILAHIDDILKILVLYIEEVRVKVRE